jgi:hypothetical protein
MMGGYERRERHSGCIQMTMYEHDTTHSPNLPSEVRLTAEVGVTMLEDPHLRIECKRGASHILPAHSRECGSHMYPPNTF